MIASQIFASSFRDPSGFLFFRNDAIYRQINSSYKENYEYLMKSGLYAELVSHNLLIPHKEASIAYALSGKAYKVIAPEQIQFISYPYEHCFSQVKDAALATLEVQRIALDFGMSLKDCSAYNIQFRECSPVLIDTLSFEKYREGEPWSGYRQFCQHFLAPLALMSYCDIRLNQLMRVYIDGIPLDLASDLLPFRTRFVVPLLMHIHLHSRSQRYFAGKPVKKAHKQMSRRSFYGLIDSLARAIQKLSWQPKGTDWINYYSSTSYSQAAMDDKKKLVSELLDIIRPKNVWDLGANTGIFSCIASSKGIPTISFDIDPACVEENYLRCKAGEEINVLPLVVDLANPSPGIGWGNEERMSIFKRGPADAVLALALMHHLAIGNNVPFVHMANFFSRLCRWLIIEFIPKDDEQVQRMLSAREDVFVDYGQNSFEKTFSKLFYIKKRASIGNSGRILYLMEKK